MLKKKIWANFQRIIELFTKKIVKKLFKIWSWDTGSGIRDPGSGKTPFRIPDPGVKKAPDPGSGSATLQLTTGTGRPRLDYDPGRGERHQNIISDPGRQTDTSPTELADSVNTKKNVAASVADP